MYRDLQLLTLKEAETLTGRKAATWRADIRKRKVPSVKLGRQVRIPLEAIRDMIQRGWRGAASENGAKATGETHGY